jgi:hypothetical protein
MLIAVSVPLPNVTVVPVPPVTAHVRVALPDPVRVTMAETDDDVFGSWGWVDHPEAGAEKAAGVVLIEQVPKGAVVVLVRVMGISPTMT